MDEVIGHVREVVGHAYDLQRKKTYGKTIPYRGYNFGLRTRVNVPTPVELLEEKSIAYHAERGRDVMDLILMIAFNLGVEQGIRLEKEKSLPLKILAEAYMAQLEKKDGIKTSAKG